MNVDPKFAELKYLMTTSTIGMVLPAFKEDFGDGKNIDLVATLSHDFISDIVEKVGKSGISLDKNGNLKLIINMGAQILVEKTRDSWEDGRTIFLTATAKAKIQINETDPETKTIIFTPKGLELSVFKIFKGKEEMLMEQMLV